MSEPGNFAKRAIAGIYSHAANRLYEPVVVNGAFPLFGGDLHDKVRALGRRAVEAAGHDPILDLPVGTAYFTVDAARHHEGLMVGSDIAAGMVRRTQEVAREQRTPNLVAVQADAHNLPFADATFGAILCINGLQVMPNLRATLKEFRRTLRPTGTLYVSLITAPLEAALPKRASTHLPTLLRSREKVLGQFETSGFEISHLQTQRFAYWFEATPHP
ncbi:MAG: class I SAM-dependent methyltransferase [Actinomycetota bacterium]|nr:methyltransferase domain-containing protein [Actinomycetota bacterium]